GLLIQTFLKLRGQYSFLQPEKILTMRTTLPRGKYKEMWRRPVGAGGANTRCADDGDEPGDDVDVVRHNNRFDWRIGLDAIDEGAVVRRERDRPADLRRDRALAHCRRVDGLLDSGAARDESRSDGRSPIRISVR